MDQEQPLRGASVRSPSFRSPVTLFTKREERVLDAIIILLYALGAMTAFLFVVMIVEWT